MKYKYGNFSDQQVRQNAKIMHNEIHKLLLHKDSDVNEVIFKNDDEFKSYFSNLLYRFGGLNSLLNEPDYMVALMSTLQAAFLEVTSEYYSWRTYRRLILDAHGFIKDMFEGV